MIISVIASILVSAFAAFIAYRLNLAVKSISAMATAAAKTDARVNASADRLEAALLQNEKIAGQLAELKKEIDAKRAENEKKSNDLGI